MIHYCITLETESHVFFIFIFLISFQCLCRPAFLLKSWALHIAHLRFSLRKIMEKAPMFFAGKFSCELKIKNGYSILIHTGCLIGCLMTASLFHGFRKYSPHNWVESSPTCNRKHPGALFFIAHVALWQWQPLSGSQNWSDLWFWGPTRKLVLVCVQVYLQIWPVQCRM